MKFQNLLTAVRLFIFMTLICGGLYPLLVTVMAHLAFSDMARGSLVRDAAGRVVGSALIAQSFREDRYIWSRPSAGEYETVAAAASNQGPLSAGLRKIVGERRQRLKISSAELADQPEMVFASASGLDPHISPAAAYAQVRRVAAARKFDAVKTAAVRILIEKMTEAPQFYIFGEPRVNVLLVNLALDRL